MDTIYKYGFPISDLVHIPMPLGAKVLTVQMQDDGPQIWALVDSDAPKVIRSFRVYGTGHPLGHHGPYVGTWQMNRGISAPLVFHLFEAA